ncbi:MAG: DNA-binding protein [Alphaproteobacteria bacterium 13_2_20CM_2_64_7]|jgi:putative hemolysin|nr:MAG: DNA-binding protein [Alphaproteobacteria bacterium 13_2_20CM_2_64_7]
MLFIEVAIVVALILLNGLLALAELAIVSSRRARLQALVDRQVIGSRRALALATDPGRFLSTVQIGITLVGVLSGAFSGATLGLHLAKWLVDLGLRASVAEAVGVGFVVAVITYFSLVIGELVPKQIALRNPEKIAVRVAPAMTALASIASPIVSFLDISGRAVLRALGYRAQPEHRVTDEEIRSLMAEAETAGVLEPGERAMIAGVMRLGDRPVRAIMTPRRQVDMIDLTADPEDIRRTIVESAHSRLPAHAGTPEEMLGVIQAKDLLDAYLRGERPDIRAQLRPAPNVPDTADALDVLGVIKRSPVHIALVHDEYGQFEGIVTNADILEAIAGAFRTDEGPLEPEAVRRQDGSWLISGSMPADEMADRLSVVLPPDRSYHTAAGFVLSQFGHLPEIGESFDSQGWRFEVVDLDGRRIDKIQASRIAALRRRAAI